MSCWEREGKTLRSRGCSASYISALIRGRFIGSSSRANGARNSLSLAGLRKAGDFRALVMPWENVGYMALSLDGCVKIKGREISGYVRTGLV